MLETKRALTAGADIVLIHPIELFSEGLRSLLQHTPYKLDWAASLETLDLDALCGRQAIFVVGGRPLGEVAATVRLIRQRVQSACVVVLGGSADSDNVLSAIQAGANGYLHEGMSLQALITTIEHVLEHGTVLPLEFVRSLHAMGKDVQAYPVHDGARDPAKSAQNGQRSAQNEREAVASRIRLSAREQAILQALAEGAPNKVIAQTLQITEATVKVHVKAILRKIRVKNRTQAAIWAVKYLGSAEARQIRSNADGLREAFSQN